MSAWEQGQLTFRALIGSNQLLTRGNGVIHRIKKALLLAVFGCGVMSSLWSPPTLHSQVHEPVDTPLSKLSKWQ